jgi:anaerobic magnesium-protoporphyrin IX monomethyl ester cyclase
MRILFVWPNKDQFGFKPMSLSLLSAILKKGGHEVDLFDTTFMDFGFKDNTEVRKKIRIFKEVDFSGYDVVKRQVDLEETLARKLDEFRPDIVGVSALSDEIYIGFEVSGIVKKWNEKTTVIWGNKAATMAPEKVLACKDVDFICLGEGIEFMPEFVECISRKGNPGRIKNIGYRYNGKIVKNELRPYYHDPDDLPFFDWSIFDKRQFLKPYDGKVYKGGDHMIYWGCPNQCTYCINSSYRKLYGPGAGRFLRRYSVDRIIGELKYLTDNWGVNFFKFHDEDFCLKPMEYFRDLAEKYQRDIGAPFTIMANARNVTRGKVDLLKKMNCVSVTLGIETGNSKLRKEILKRRETREEIIEATKMFNDAGIRTSAFNMLAIPYENRQTVMETIELNRKAGVLYPNAGFFFPLEGTELRDIAIHNGFFDGSSDLVFRNDRPTLVFPDISGEELIALRERFVLYIKMPYVFQKYIERSERNDPIGRKLTDELYKIYDECAFVHDGKWNDNGKLKYYLNLLNSIYPGAN